VYVHSIRRSTAFCKMFQNVKASAVRMEVVLVDVGMAGGTYSE
jgi:hypothetical protein